MNKDYVNQESTEEYTARIINRDTYLLECLSDDEIDALDIINFKRYSIVDNERPKLCADRLDGVILTGLFWTKNLNIWDIIEIFNHLVTSYNEDGEMELGFDDLQIALKVMAVSDSIDLICHSNEDNFMMELLAWLTRYIINNKYISYDELYTFDEPAIHHIFESINDVYFYHQYRLFKTISQHEVPFQAMPSTKKRELKILVNGKRTHL